MKRVSELKNKLGKMIAKRQFSAIKMIMKMLAMDEEDIRLRKFYREEPRERNKEIRREIRKTKDIKTKLTEAFIATFVGGAGGGEGLGAISLIGRNAQSAD